MKHMLSGMATAAALVVAVPLAANAAPTGLSMPTVGSARGVELVAGSSPNAEQHTSKARKARHHHAARHPVSRRPSDNMAGQLNAQEAARNAGAPAPAYGGATNVYGQPNQVYGIPGAG